MYTYIHKSTDPENQPFEQKLMCGMFSGVCVATILTPVELIKCRMQVCVRVCVRSVRCSVLQCVAGCRAHQI